MTSANAQFYYSSSDLSVVEGILFIPISYYTLLLGSIKVELLSHIKESFLLLCHIHGPACVA